MTRGTISSRGSGLAEERIRFRKAMMNSNENLKFVLRRRPEYGFDRAGEAENLKARQGISTRLEYWRRDALDNVFNFDLHGSHAPALASQLIDQT
jgi:hypothetical protein